jgi:hypothetical protein
LNGCSSKNTEEKVQARKEKRQAVQANRYGFHQYGQKLPAVAPAPGGFAKMDAWERAYAAPAPQ